MSGPSQPKGGEADPRIGTLLADRYRIDELVGEGGMGKVYSAEHVLMRKRLAVKVLRRELTCVADVVARFEREAMAAANIDHPNVAAATDFGKLPDGAVFLVLEFVSGHGLRDEIARGPFGVERALHVARQIAAALSAAHLQGIVHRDLKPENVMLVEKGGDPDFVKVLDFGIAKVPVADSDEAAKKAGNPLTKAGMVFGTPEYMAPEQALGQNVDGRADLYALGVILFEMLAGVRPFTSQSSVGILGQQLSKPAPTFAERAPGVAVPPGAEQITHKLLARDSAERYQTAADLARAIDELLAPLPGQGVYRFTLADGSRPSLSSQEAKQRALELAQQSDAESLPPARASSAAAAAWAPQLPRAKELKNRFIAVVRGFERWRRRWPVPVRDALRPVPTPALFLGTALVSVVLLFALGAALFHVLHAKHASSSSARASASARAGASASAATASESVLHDAQKSGLPALQALATTYPRDARLAVEVARSALDAKDFVAAANSVDSALSLDPTLAGDPDVARILFQSAQVKPASDASFALLFGPMGAHGADVLYDLATTDAVKLAIRVRADLWLRSPDSAHRMSPALSIAVALRFATSCAERARLLTRAKSDADQRSLGYLDRYRATTGCGWRRRNDCFACLHHDARLSETIALVRGRLPGAPPASTQASRATPK
jgi:serine/threonine protein kinase